MPTNDFLPFAGGVGANVISQSSYAALSSLLSSGFSAGTAPSNECNKVWRQSTIMAAVLAQFIVDETGQNAVDDGTTATLLANLKLAIQPAISRTAHAGGTADAITATFTNPPTTFVDGLSYYVRAASANATTTPTFTPNSGTLAAHMIVKGNGAALAAGDIAGAGHWLELQYDTTLTAWVLLNPATGVSTLNSQVPVRQTVLAGPDDTNGLPSFLPATSASLAVTSQNISSVAPLVVTAANGSGANGDSNFVWAFTANQTWSGLTDTATNFLYVNAQTGALGFTTLAPIYQWGGTPSVTAGQATYNIQEGLMYLGNGATAPATPIVFVGEAVASGGTITSTVAYAYRGQYISADTTPLPGTGTAVVKNTNIGITTGVQLHLEIECITADQGYSVGDIIASGVSGGNATFDQPLSLTKTRNTEGFTTGNSTAWDLMNKSTGAPAVAAAANWKYRMIAKRGW